jgi:hypothetical protein
MWEEFVVVAIARFTDDEFVEWKVEGRVSNTFICVLLEATSYTLFIREVYTS